MLDALLVTLSAIASIGVAAVELHRPVAARGDGRASAGYPLGRAVLAAIVAALLALLAWRIASLTLGTGTSLAAGATLLVFALWRLTDAIARVSDVPGGAADAQSAPMEQRGSAATAATAATAEFPELLAGWLSVALVILTAALATGLAAAAIAGGAAALLAFGALVAGPLRAFLDRRHRGVPALLVSVLVATLGTLWAGAGVGITWPGGGASILALFLGYLTVSAGAVEVARQWTHAARPLTARPFSGERTEDG